MSRLFPVFVILTVVLAAVSCHRPAKSRIAEKEATAETDTTEATTDTILIFADSLLAEMTREQRVGQLIMPALYSRTDYFTMKKVVEYAERHNIGGLMLLKGDMIQAAEIADTLSAHSKTAPFVAIDAEWGLAMRLEDAPRFQRNPKLAEIADDSIMHVYGSEIARECGFLGINMVMGPVMDVASNGSPLFFRSFGDDAEKVGKLAVAYSKGLESGGVISVAKHFPGHGSVSGDSHRETPVIRRSLHDLDSIDLHPFKLYIESGLSGIMVGHLSVPSIDPEALPAAVSKVVITDLLREDLGFKGLVVTDALNMAGVEGFGAADAFLAGADIILAPAHTEESIAEIVELVENDSVAAKMLDDKVRRVLYFKLKKGIIKPEGGHTGEVSYSIKEKVERIGEVPESLDRIRR